MPQLYNNILAVTKDEIIPYIYYDEAHFQQAMDKYKGKIYGIRVLREEKDGLPMLIRFASLPKSVRHFASHGTYRSSIIETMFEIDKSAIEYFEDPELIQEFNLTEAQSGQCIINASIIRALNQYNSWLFNDPYSRVEDTNERWRRIHKEAVEFKTQLSEQFGYTHTLPDNYDDFMNLVISYNEVHGNKLLLNEFFHQKTAE